MIATVVGSYPKISSDESQPNLRSAINRFERGRLGPVELEEVVQATLARIIREQEEAGIELVTDGLLRWDDPVTPFLRDLGSLAPGGLVRFFDNNVYYRRPRVTGRLWFRGSSLTEQYRQAVRHARRPVKAVLPGPYTFARLVEDEHYRNLEGLVADLAENLHLEARALVEAGCRWIQLDEPALAFHPEDVALARSGVARVVEGLSRPGEPVTTAVYVYFRDPAPLLDGLAEFPVDVVGLDLASGPGGTGTGPEGLAGGPTARRLAAEGFPRAVALGCLNGREIRMEPLEEILGLLERVSRHIPPERLYVKPSCGLEFLPHDAALRKLQQVGRAVRAFRGEGRGA